MSKKGKTTRETTAPAVQLPMTVAQAARLWGVTETRVKIWCQQGRVKHERVGGGARRAGVLLILQSDRPERLARGSLKPEQRAQRIPKRKRASYLQGF